MDWTIAAFYRFTPIDDPAALKAQLLAAFEGLTLCGTLLLAHEGFNATLAGNDAAIDAVRHTLALHPDEIKFSYATVKPFARLKLRIKREIITLRQPEADPSRHVGTYVEAADWNALIADPDVLVLDTRNRYETAEGTFAGAIDPGLDSFGQFPDFVSRLLDPRHHRRVAMFCTGGIRCEKASAYLLSQGFEEVYHLKGGILKYLETVPPAESLWQGGCYVFDERVAVGHGVAPIAK
jgi:UPF0176 protein